MSTWTHHPDTQALLERRLAPLTPRQRATVEEYLRARRRQGLKASTLGANASILAAFADTLCDRAFEEATTLDADHHLEKLTNSPGRSGAPMRQSTLYHQWVVLKTFYDWVWSERRLHTHQHDITGLDSNLQPKTVNPFTVITVSRPRKSDLSPDDLLTPQDVARLLDGQSVMDQAVLMTLYDAGLRNAELRSLRVDSLRVDDDGQMSLTLPKDGKGLKTGPRKVWIFSAEEYLKDWLANHPDSANGSAPLFLHTGKGGRQKSIDANYVAYLMRRISDRLDKPVWPHLFRHTAATNYARRGVGEAAMRVQFGWSRTSDMPAYYTHLANTDAEDIIRVSHGREPRNTATAPAIESRCLHCGHGNKLDAELCKRCNRPVSPEMAERLERRRHHDVQALVVEQLRKLMKDRVDDDVRRALMSED